MDLTVKVDGDDAVADAKSLKDFLENRGAKGLTGVEMIRAEHNEGEQGLGAIVGKLLLKVMGADEVVKGVIQLLNTWAQQHDKRIHLPNGVIIPPNILTPEQIMEIISKLQPQQ